MIEGIHNAVVVEHRTVTSPGGTPYVLVTFQLNDNETIQARIFLTEKAAGIARKSLKAIGFDPDKQDLSALDENQHLLTGREAELDIREEEYRGRTSLKVAFINPIRSRLDGAQSAKYSQMLREIKQQEDADIPF